MSEEDPALQPAPVITAPGDEYADSARAFQGIPSIELHSGSGVGSSPPRLWAAWYGGGPGEGPENYVLLATSGDAGQTWSAPILVIDPPGNVRAFDPCLWCDPAGRLWLFWAQAYHHWDGRAGVWAIVTDEPGAERPAWSAPRRLCNGIMINKPTVLRTGEWLLPVSVWNLPPNAPGGVHTHDLSGEKGSNVFCSLDGGTTWSMRGQALVPERRCDEHMIVERRDGALWMLVRTAYGIGESISTDRGTTWSPGKPSAIAHIPAARFFIRRLGSGALLLVKHAPPSGSARSHLTAFLSDDDGATWRGGLLLDDRDGVSYPDGVQDADGTIYLIYDYSRRGEKQILLALFSEEDVRAGNLVSAQGRRRILVNQATGHR